MRLLIDNINNGRWYNDYGGTYFTTIKRAMVYELEAYGPDNQ